MGVMDKFSRKKKQPIHLDDNEKGAAYEKSGRTGGRPNSLTSSQSSRSNIQYGGYTPIHPNVIRVLRFLLYGLTSMSALATAGVAIAVVHYYNTHGPVIKPSWGSLIAIIVFGIGTPGVLYGTMLVTPLLFKHSSVLGIINQTRTELLMLFAVSAIWISGALALACDLRGRENCLWDGFYHYPKPSDFNSVCTLINVDVALAYTTFGLAALQMVVVWSIAIYIILFLDQEALTEKTNYLGTRSHKASKDAQSQKRSLLAARQGGVSRAGPYRAGSSIAGGSAVGPMAGGVHSSRKPPPEILAYERENGSDVSPPMINSRSNSGHSSGGPMAGGRASDPESVAGTPTAGHQWHQVDPEEEQDDGQYFGYERGHNRSKSRV